VTIKQMIKLRDEHNKAAELFGTEKVQLWIRPSGGWAEPIGTYKEFKAYVDEEYIEPLAKAVLEYDGFEVENTAAIEWHDAWGGGTEEFSIEVTTWSETTRRL
jgi:hypothetical protein